MSRIGQSKSLRDVRKTKSPEPALLTTIFSNLQLSEISSELALVNCGIEESELKKRTIHAENQWRQYQNKVLLSFVNSKVKANATTLTSLMKDWKIVRTLVDTILAAMNNSSVNSNPSASRKENIVYVLKVLQDILDDVPSVESLDSDTNEQQFSDVLWKISKLEHKKGHKLAKSEKNKKRRGSGADVGETVGLPGATPSAFVPSNYNPTVLNNTSAPGSIQQTGPVLITHTSSSTTVNKPNALSLRFSEDREGLSASSNATIVPPPRFQHADDSSPNLVDQHQNSVPSLNANEELLSADINESDETRDALVTEITNSEELYCNNLTFITDVYMKQLKDLISDAEMKTLFSNVANIRNFNKKLLDELNGRLKNWNATAAIGDIFLKFHPFFRMYVEYCKNFEKADDLLKQLRKRAEVDKALNSMRKSSGNLDLETLLIDPVQRIPRYTLMLNDLGQNTAKEHPDFNSLTQSATKMAEIAQVVTDSMKYNPSATDFQQILESVSGIAKYMKPSRKFVAELLLNVAFLDYGKTLKFQPFWCLLFSDSLFLATGSAKQKRKLRHHVMLINTWFSNAEGSDVVEVQGPESTQFLIKVTPKEKSSFLDAVNKCVRELPTAKKNIPFARSFQYKYSHGGIYDGEWLNCRPHGEGIYWFPNGVVYKGSFRDGLIDGSGVLTFSPLQRYEGQFREGQPTGRGKYLFNHLSFDGEIKNNKYDAGNKSNTLIWSNGDKFVGDFKDSKMDGNASISFKDGCKFDGTMQANELSGKGVMSYWDGSTYDGEFQNDDRHGKGKFVSANSLETYDGEWLVGNKHGNGVWTHKNGSNYSGDWSAGLKQGKGTLILKNSPEKTEWLKYVGDFHQDQFHGYGELSWNGITYKGSWQFGKMEGTGRCKTHTGTYNGTFKNGMLHGSVSYTCDASGMKVQGEWLDGFPSRAVSTFKTKDGKVRTQDFDDGVSVSDKSALTFLPPPSILL